VEKTSNDVISMQTEEIESQDEDGKPLNSVYQFEETEGLRDPAYPYGVSVGRVRRQGYWYSKYCNILMVMCFLGGLSAYTGHVIAPDCSDPDTAFETVGILAFQISWLGFIACPIIWINSLFHWEVDSYREFFLTLRTGIVMGISSAIFMDYILQDMFCGCWGICGIGTGWGG
tara:strand:- start:876 stop:1394 length:519 start_codon:yes stop_codon:yes gene_type:complete